MTASHATAASRPAFALFAAGCLVAACSSLPFDNASDFDRTFIGAAQTWDLNKDGAVTCEEWQQYATTSLRESDGNGDGALDQAEWARLVKGDRLFETAGVSYYDLNSDGRVSPDEITGKPNLAFKLLDKNGDCRIDRTESVQIVGSEIIKPKAKEVDQTIPKPGGR